MFYAPRATRMNRLVVLFVAFTFLVSGIPVSFAHHSGSPDPFFDSLDQFVLFAQDDLEIDYNVSVSSGDLGANDEVEIGHSDPSRPSLIQGNIYSDEVLVGRHNTVNGDVFYNTLHTTPSTVINGSETHGQSLPVGNVPHVDPVQAGADDFKIAEDETQVVPTGAHDNLIIKDHATGILEGGDYYIEDVEMSDDSTLVFNAPSTLYIQERIEAAERVSIVPGPGMTPDDLLILIEEEDNTDFEEEANLSFVMIAPLSDVRIEKDSVFRGQILAWDIDIRRGVQLSRSTSFVYPTPPGDIVEDPDGGTYPVNQILLDLVDGASYADAQAIAAEVGGTIVGAVESVNLYQILVPRSETIEDLEDALAALDSLGNLLVESTYKNIALDLFAGPYDLDNLRDRGISPITGENYVVSYDLVRVQEAWDAILSSGAPLNPVTVGIVDSGIHPDHSEFAGVSIVSSLPLSDARSHGTAVSGIIGANNLSDNASLPADSPQMNGFLSGVLLESEYTLELEPFGVGNDPENPELAISGMQALEKILKGEDDPAVVNMSFGNNACEFTPQGVHGRANCLPLSEIHDLQQTYEDFFEANTDTLFVIAAGNAGINAVYTTPANTSSLTNVITVGAVQTDLSGMNAHNGVDFITNFGPKVDIAAVGQFPYVPISGGTDTYDYYLGTSFAAPMVAGTAGLLKSINPLLTPEQLKDELISNTGRLYTDDIAEVNHLGSGSDCHDGTIPGPGEFVYGCLLNVERAVQRVLPVTGDVCPSGTLTEDFTVTAGASPCVMDETLVVPAGITLTVEPGVVMKFEATTGIEVDGALSAIGTAAEPIYFTSIHDDSVDGDTNGNGGATTPAPGDWESIIGNFGATIDLAYVDWYYSTEGVFIEGDSLTVDNAIARYNLSQNLGAETDDPAAPVVVSNSEFTDSAVGIFVDHGALTLTDSDIDDNGIGVQLSTDNSDFVITDNEFSRNEQPIQMPATANLVHSGNIMGDNDINGLVILNGQTFEDATWAAEDDVPYVIGAIPCTGCGASLLVGPGTTLTIEPGVVVKVANDKLIRIGGTLDALGSAAENIHITHLSDDSVGGDTNNNGNIPVDFPNTEDWPGFEADPGSVINLEHTQMRYMGHGIFTQGDITIDHGHFSLTDFGIEIVGNGHAEITNTVFTEAVVGIAFENTTTGTVSGSSFHDNEDAALTNGGSSTIVATGNWWGDATGPFHTTLNPGGLGDVVEGDVLFTPFLTSDPFGSSAPGVCPSGTLAADTTITTDVSPCVISIDVIVPAGISLTVEPGVVVKFDDGNDMFVYGTLNAVGTQSDRIYFTSLKDDSVGGDTNGDGSATSPAPGDWEVIRVDEASSVANIAHADWRYSVSGIYMYQGGSLTMDHGHGYLNSNENLRTSGTVVVTNSEFNNSSKGIEHGAGSLSVSNSSIHDNTAYGILNNALAATDATNNWWGDASGPYHPVIASGGLGDTVSDNVNFVPYLATNPL